MKILLVNPNRFKSPPVPPLGLEYLSGCLENDGDSVKIVDLCFSENVYQDLDTAIKSFRPDIAGITIRNVDSVLYHDNEFYLREIKDIVYYLKASHRLKVLVGGTGLMTNPQGVLEYLGADYALIGPSEDDICSFIRKIHYSSPIEKIHYAECRSGCSHQRLSSQVDYRKYYQNGGIAGFQTHKGCSSSCVYCIEADSPVVFNRPKDIVQEIKGLVDAGYNHLHLCDSEFNEDLDFSLTFCSALKLSGMGLRWTVYMKPTNYNVKLFRLMKETGVYLITLTVDSFNKCSMYWSDVEKIIFNARSNNISLAVDFLAGFPYEEESVLIGCLDLFRRVQPDVVNINTYIRLYPSLKVTKTVIKDSTLHPYLRGATDDRSMIRPVFYNHVSDTRLEELISGEKIFKIAGRGRGVNYCNVTEDGIIGR